MAKVVFGAAVSHTPILSLEPAEWEHRSQTDLNNPALNASDGRFFTYEQLLAEVGAKYADVAKVEVYQAKSERSQCALDRVAKDLAEAAPDVVVIVGDDQRELFSEANQPMMAVFCGQAITMMARYASRDLPQWLRNLGVGYAMDDNHVFPAAPALAHEVIGGLVDRDFDIAAVNKVEAPERAGFGHAYGFVIRRLFGGQPIPVLPLLLNTYYPPNVPSAARCFALGQALRGVIEASPSDARVALIASGGLSHFIVDEMLDRRVFEGLSTGNGELLKSIPRRALNSGSSEILNWVTVAGAFADLAPEWTDYYPVYRTPAGTGIGLGFASWPRVA